VQEIAEGKEEEEKEVVGDEDKGAKEGEDDDDSGRVKTLSEDSLVSTFSFGFAEAVPFIPNSSLCTFV
jgi:hypothetical protein